MTELKIERKLAADAKTVFEYVTQTRHLLKWWGPEGMTVPEHDLDLSKPGPWSSVMMNADGQRYKVTGEVIAVDPPHSVEFTWGWHDENDVRGHDTRVRFEIHPAGSGTRFVLVHTGLADEESAKNHEMGWSSSLNKLERLAS
jgi:uncharacterized protein YndB with AHSA1/START domain